MHVLIFHDLNLIEFQTFKSYIDVEDDQEEEVNLYVVYKLVCSSD